MSEKKNKNKNKVVKKINVCSRCGRELKDEKYLICPRNSKSLVLQCLECFSIRFDCDYAEEERPHYMVIHDRNPINLLTNDWDSNEEALLLALIETQGIGNLPAIERFFPNRSKEEIEAHYLEIYINSDTAPLPEYPKTPKEGIPCYPPPSYRITNKIIDPKIVKDIPKTPAEANNFMPFRHEFDIEYENRADEIVMDIKFTEDDTMESFNKKVNDLLLYNDIVAERRSRTKFIEDWDFHEKTYRGNPSVYQDVGIFSSITQEAHRVAEIIAPLAAHIGKDESERLFQLVTQCQKSNIKIDSNCAAAEMGAQTPSEGMHVLQMEKLLQKNGAVDPRSIDRFNLEMKACVEEHRSAAPEPDLLTDEELQVATDYGAPHALILALKCALVREAAFQPFSVEESEAMVPDYPGLVASLCQLYKANGVI